MKKIKAEIVADSVNSKGQRLTSYLLTFPRFILPELLTHRVFSRNSASSRAIPFKTMLEQVENDPFTPIAWQKDHKGMQGSDYLSEKMSSNAASNWGKMSKETVRMAKSVYENYFNTEDSHVTKQLCNRLLEPFMWHTVLVTATEYENFFELRCPKYGLYAENIPMEFKSKKDFNDFTVKVGDEPFVLTDLGWQCINKSQAEIHIQALAESMWDEMKASSPKQLKNGEYHLPFSDNFDMDQINRLIESGLVEDFETAQAYISVARCARLSYMTFDNQKVDHLSDITLFNRLRMSKHLSPFEHIAKSMTESDHTDERFRKGLEYSWCNNFQGFIQMRYDLEK